MGKKLKYKDVVKKGPKGFDKKHNNKKSKFNVKQHDFRKKQQGGKKYNNVKKRKAYSNDKDKEFNNSKRLKQENPVQPEKPIVQESSSEDEEAAEEDPRMLLRQLFGMKTDASVLSDDSESEEDDEVEDTAKELENNGKTTDTGSDDNVSEASNDTEDELDVEVQEEEEENIDDSKDPFVRHLHYELHPALVEALESDPPAFKKESVKWPKLGDIEFEIPDCEISETKKVTLLDTTIYATPGQVSKQINRKTTPKELFIKSQISKNIPQANKSLKNENLLTPLQRELFSIINNYQDLFYSERTFDNAEEIRFIYCLHVVNHVLKTRIKVLHHNAKLSKKNDGIVPDEYRDQGLVRPKVLILVPFRDAAYKIVNTISDIMFSENKGNVLKRERFVEEFTGHDLFFPKKNPKPNDYEKTFSGNIGEDFRIGLSFTKKCIKLYSDFYSSDVIIASPLGLRTIIGMDDKEKDSDFLTSIELLILDQTEIFMMQNWLHLLQVFDHLHLKPKTVRTDISRIRVWSSNLWAKYYRQTLIFSSVLVPHIYALFKRCLNFEGRAKVTNVTEEDCLGDITVRLPHYFHKIVATNREDEVEARLEYFCNTVLPRFRENAEMVQILVYIPCSLDFMRVRHYFKQQDINFKQIWEQSKEGKVAQVREMFFHGNVQFLLYTERFHFYNRIRIKGIRHIIFFEPPVFPHFYEEMCELMRKENMNKKIGNDLNMSVTLLYSEYSLLRLAPIIGRKNAVDMFQSNKNVHMIRTSSKLS